MSSVLIHTIKQDKSLSLSCELRIDFFVFSLREVRIGLVPYMLGPFSQNFHPRLVIRKFQAISLSLRAPKTPSTSTRALLSRNYNVCENSPSCEIPTRKIPVLPLSRKSHLVQIGAG